MLLLVNEANNQQNNSFYLPQHWYENFWLYPGFMGLTLIQAMVWYQQQQASAWINDNQDLSSPKWHLEHIFILPGWTKPSTQPYYSTYHEIIYMDQAPVPLSIFRSNSMKIQNALVSNILNRSQRYFAHVTTVTLSWRVQNIVVIGRVYFTLECFEFSSNFEFDRNMLSGTGARSRNCGCLITWFCYQLIAKPGNKTVPVPWLDPYSHVDSSVKHLAADPTTRLWTVCVV